MVRGGFEPDFPPAVMTEVRAMVAAAKIELGMRDLRQLLWSSIDNPESRDLDQVEVAEQLVNGDIKVLVGIADVDALVKAGSATDQHAGHNTTSVYCGVATFPMLPEHLSTDLTSLNENVDRASVVIEFVVAPDGTVRSRDVYRAMTHNTRPARLSQRGRVAGRKGPAPAKVAASAPLEAQLRLQDKAAQLLRKQRHLAGALELETIEATPVAEGNHVTNLFLLGRRTTATYLIEDFMIAANTTMALFLDGKGSSSIRRVVKVPERWDRIVALAATLVRSCRPLPIPARCRLFSRSAALPIPITFPISSLSVVKLMGPGIYVLERPGETGQGPFRPRGA